MRILLLFGLAIAATTTTWCQDSRPFYMSVSGVQTIPMNSPPYVNFPAGFTPSAVANDSDLISVFPEYLGIPFDLFATTSDPPSSNPWVVQMTALANQAKSTGKPILLQTALIRETPVGKVNISGTTVTVDSGWAPACLDFNQPQYTNLTSAYGNYAYWMMRTFTPRYYVVMVEANLYWARCGGSTASWLKFVELYQNAYHRAKLANDSAAVFPSFKLEDIYGQDLNGFDTAQWSAMASLQRDRLGLAIYPFGVQVSSWQFANPYQLPSDYLSRIRMRYPNEPKIVVTETGWNSEPISITSGGPCYSNLIYSSQSFQTAYLNYLIYFSYTANVEAIGWWSDRDLILSSAMSTCFPNAPPPDYIACGGDTWCRSINADKYFLPPGGTDGFAEIIFKAFGAMGLRDYNGNPKPEVYDLWKRFLELPRQ
ncbi:hypothetical protein BH10ACI4_BH10ACI4_33880 [soil metagenome]